MVDIKREYHRVNSVRIYKGKDEGKSPECQHWHKKPPRFALCGHSVVD